MINVASDVMEEVEVDHTNGESVVLRPLRIKLKEEHRSMTWSPNYLLKTVVVGLAGRWAPDLPLRIQALFQLS